MSNPEGIQMRTKLCSMVTPIFNLLLTDRPHILMVVRYITHSTHETPPNSSFSVLFWFSVVFKGPQLTPSSFSWEYSFTYRFPQFFKLWNNSRLTTSSKDSSNSSYNVFTMFLFSLTGYSLGIYYRMSTPGIHIDSRPAELYTIQCA